MAYLPSALCLAFTSQPNATGSSTQRCRRSCRRRQRPTQSALGWRQSTADLFHLKVHPMPSIQLLSHRCCRWHRPMSSALITTHRRHWSRQERCCHDSRLSGTKMSVMMHSFVPLLLRDKEHPMHNYWHTRLSINTMKSLSPAAQSSHLLHVECGMSVT